MGKPNVVLITADSIRADHCGFLNDSMTTTPNLDRMADEGVVFETAIAPGPRTMSSVPPTHTGTPLPITDHDDREYSEKAARIRQHIENNTTISERFKQQGYATVGFSANPWTSRDVRFDKGFDIYKEVAGEARSHIPKFAEGTPLGGPLRIFSQWRHKDIWFSRWPTFYDEIVSTVDRIDEPYFLWIFLIDSHNPYLVPKPDRTESSTLGMYYGVLRSNTAMSQREDDSSFRDDISPHVEKHLKRAYRDSIRSVDRFVGRLRNELPGEDNVLAFHSDHGEAFGEHGTYGHARQVYEENIRVPLLIHGTEERGAVDEQISLLRIPELLEDALDNEIRTDDLTEEYVFSRTENSKTIAVRGEDWKLIRSNGNEELYHLSTDPDERDDRAADDPERREQYSDVLNDHLDSLPKLSLESDEGGDSVVESRLESLGYL